MTPAQEEAFRREVLLPCPFCGSDEIMAFCDPDEGRDNSGPSRRIQCAGCNIEAPFYPTEAEAVAAWNIRALAASQPAPAAYTGQAVAWTDDAERWGGALNEASWKFTEVCPEKSSMLFNHCKPALREAILTYAAAVRKAHPAPLDAERVREDEEEQYLQEVADGAWGDGPMKRGAARDRLAALRQKEASK